ncbi:hypothetical protein F0562_014298 [Nyssa sinensis]|uniref:Uncharacterized protein n=1 Tax=Nyssa sinensis TaxID=561372 RepID=A0A5J4ZQP7_9ASTE|nr:hypothetical protein F0562_014298 [Nyssa sinensis]
MAAPPLPHVTDAIATTHVANTANLLREHEDLVNDKIEKAETKLNCLKDAFEVATESSVEDAVQTKVIEDKLHNLENLVTKLKLQIPAKYKTNSMDSNPSYGFANGEQLNAKHVPNELLNLHKYPTFEHSFQVLHNGLKTELKLCLLCFSMFPEDVIIKKRLMIYWWIGKGFVSQTPALCTDPSPRVKKTGEELGNDPTPRVRKTDEELGNLTLREEELGVDPTPGVKKIEEKLGNPASREEELGNETTSGIKETAKELSNDPTPRVKKTTEELGNEYFNELMVKGRALSSP